jgi:hypothetical protein
MAQSRRGRPRYGRLSGDGPHPATLEVVDEVAQQPVIAVELEAHGAADGQVLIGRLAQAAHCPTPGQGWAMRPRAQMSSLA